MECVTMMDDHFILSAVRNHLVEALQALLVADIMTERDFRAARWSANMAIANGFDPGEDEDFA